jgi:hypothetical protein
MIIGFSEKTSKILPKIFCKKFCHCAVIIECKVQNAKCKYIFMHVVKNKIHTLTLSARDLKILEKHGWTFLHINLKKEKNIYTLCSITYALSCVGFTKRALGIHNPFIWTPDQLYKLIMNNEQ